jgi:hypothetical protein
MTINGMRQGDTAVAMVPSGLERLDAWVRGPLFWDTLREWLIIAALLLSPLSYVVKLVYDLPFPWIDPTLLIGAAAALLPPWSLPASDRRLRSVVLCTMLFLGVYWLSATVAVAKAQFSSAEPFREPTRTTLGVLLCLGCMRVWRDRSALRRAADILGWVAAAEVVIAAYLLIGLAFNLPMPAQWRAYEEAYWFRQAFYAGKIVWPRLGGTFVEAPPFGLYILGALIVRVIARHAARPEQPSRHGRWVDAILWIGLAGSLSSQVLIGAMLWGLLLAGFDLYVRRQPSLWHAAGVVVLVALFSAGVYKKYLESRRPEPEIGSSVGERRAHTMRAWHIFLDSPVLGVGPGQYGQVAMRESASLYDPRVSPQFVPAELLADTGALGMSTALLLVASIMYVLLESRSYSALSAAAGLLVADSFQANWRWPMLFITIAVLLVVSTTQSVSEQSVRATPG